ncbi:FUSC family protein [Nakamurella leprariae]|uniref:FUSC family protein n=1 Tax=Nakamurella leprariae TaxID=2803911 RepID=A0A938YE57_9ACTN|nr:FUSC family protein [Nakamurella leprariae]MBM9466777.1 FUSC family protein [Nakamurella leprariae]
MGNGSGQRATDRLRPFGSRLRPGRIGGSRRARLRRLVGIDRRTLLQAVKVAVSAGVAWQLALLWTHSAAPIWAPISACLIALLTVQASVRDAAEKILAVLAGIAVAILLGGLVGLHVWSICLTVFVCVLIGRLLRLGGGAAVQVSVSGLFVLAIGSSTGPERLLDTLIGAGVAVAVNLLIVPPNHVQQARRAAANLVDGVLDVLQEMADGIGRPWRAEQTAHWLRDARGQTGRAAEAEREVETAGQSLQLVPGRGGWAAVLGDVEQAVDTMRIVEVQVRVLARTLRDTALKVPSAEDGSQPPYTMASEMLGHAADAVERFGQALLDTERTPRAVADAETAIGAARRHIQRINADVADMVAANLGRGILLGALVVETSRILDQLDGGLRAAAGLSNPTDLGLAGA